MSVASLDPDGVKVELGDQVLVAGVKQGIIRYYGKTDFAPGRSAVKSCHCNTGGDIFKKCLTNA